MLVPGLSLCGTCQLTHSVTRGLRAWPDWFCGCGTAGKLYECITVWLYDYNYNCKCNVYYKLWFNSRLVIRCYTDTDRYGYGTRIRSDQARGSKSGIDWKTGQKAILPTGLHLYTGGFECQDSWTDWTSALHRWWWMLQNQWPVGLHWQDLSTLNVSRKKLDLNITEETLHCSGARRSLQSSVSQSVSLWFYDVPLPVPSLPLAQVRAKFKNFGQVFEIHSRKTACLSLKFWFCVWWWFWYLWMAWR